MDLINTTLSNTEPVEINAATILAAMEALQREVNQKSVINEMTMARWSTYGLKCIERPNLVFMANQGVA